MSENAARKLIYVNETIADGVPSVQLTEDEYGLFRKQLSSVTGIELGENKQILTRS